MAADMSLQHIRKRRLLKALQDDAMPTNISCSVKCEVDRLSPQNKQQKKQIDSTYTAMEMKLKVIENWEATKLAAIERLALEVEALQEIEEKIELGELELEKRGLKIDEKDFQNMCAREWTSSSSNYSSVDITHNTPADCKTSVQRQLFTTLHNGKKSSSRRTMPAGIKATCSVGNDSDMVVIGPNCTKVSKAALIAINWSLSGAAVTRKILMEVFDRNTLAFHTLTGKPSPAFMDCDKPLKNQLDPAKVADIVHIVTTNLDMTAKEVRSAITTKCADENKMFRQREQKRLKLIGRQRGGLAIRTNRGDI